MNVYGQAQDDRLAEAVERVAEVVIPVKRVPVEYQQVVGSELKSATPLETESCALQFWWRRRELNPTQAISTSVTSETDSLQIRTISAHDNGLDDSDHQVAGQNETLSGQDQDTVGNQNCAPECAPWSDLPDDIAQVVAAWNTLPEQDKEAILEIVKRPRGR